MKTRGYNLLTVLMMISLIILSACQEKPRIDGAFVDLGEQVTEPEPEPEPEPEITRPDGVIFFKNDFCACNNQKSVIISGTTCTNFCSTKNTGSVDTLYFNFTVGDEIISQGFRDVAGWCKDQIADGNNPQCVLEARSETGTEAPISFNIGTGNSFTAPISTLAPDKTYIITLKELTSGSKSNSIQLRKLSDGPGTPQLGPLVVQPVTQYTCINRRILEDTNNGDTFYEFAVRLHFYFIETARPEKVPAGISDVFCHDVNLYPGPDKNSNPRLEETPGAYALWSREDIRFFDLDTPPSGQRDVNELIAKKAADYGAPFTAVPNLFFELTMSSGPTINEVGNVSSSGLPLGLYMSYLNDAAAGNIAYCPKQAHYNAGDTALRAIGDVIQTDTEGIYLAKRETETFTNSQGETECLPMDIIVTRETDMKRVWFYRHPTTRQPTQPVSPSTLRNNTIKFFYPYDFTSPYVKKSYQKEYTVILPNQVEQGTCSESTGGTPTPAAGGIPTTYTPHDRRFGCIPVSTTP